MPEIAAKNRQKETDTPLSLPCAAFGIVSALTPRSSWKPFSSAMLYFFRSGFDEELVSGRDGRRVLARQRVGSGSRPRMSARSSLWGRMPKRLLHERLPNGRLLCEWRRLLHGRLPGEWPRRGVCRPACSRWSSATRRRQRCPSSTRTGSSVVAELIHRAHSVTVANSLTRRIKTAARFRAAVFLLGEH